MRGRPLAENRIEVLCLTLFTRISQYFLAPLDFLPQERGVERGWVRSLTFGFPFLSFLNVFPTPRDLKLHGQPDMVVCGPATQVPLARYLGLRISPKAAVKMSSGSGIISTLPGEKNLLLSSLWWLLAARVLHDCK